MTLLRLVQYLPFIVELCGIVMEELGHQLPQRLLVLRLEGGGLGIVEVENVGTGEKSLRILVVKTGQYLNYTGNKIT